MVISYITRSRARPAWWPALLVSLVLVGAAGCVTHNAKTAELFPALTPYAKKLRGSGEEVCWAVKRAFLSQGYMMEGSTNNSLIMVGTRDTQKDDVDVTLRLQTTCIDDKDGLSTVFVTAMREESKLQKVSESQTYGVSIATVSVPSGSTKVLRVVKRESIDDPAFYDSFYRLVQHFADEEHRAAALSRRDERRSQASDRRSQDEH